MAIYPDHKTSVAKTANYGVVASDDCKRFTNFGATGAVQFNLPPIADVWDGWNIEVMILADQTVTIAAPSGKLVAGNNAAATSIAFSTSAEKVGCGAFIYYDGPAALYVAQPILGLETATPTIA